MPAFEYIPGWTLFQQRRRRGVQKIESDRRVHVPLPGVLKGAKLVKGLWRGPGTVAELNVFNGGGKSWKAAEAVEALVIASNRDEREA
ncbi:hypothetical protein LTR50_005810 [Elasticomyces elasticus]|nr:hypothetical protein LTR50_005810 [Elasticomyces elasticus]